jgi:hypothetical protein
MREELPFLYYLSEKRSNLLPEWAYFFMRLGYQLATVPKKNYRVVTGLAIPTRVFACSLAATGVVLARAGNTNSTDTLQIQYIRSLKPGTSIYVRTDDNRKLRGVIEKFEEIRNEEWIFIRTGKREILPRPLSRFASRITVSDSNVSLPEYSRSGYRTETPSDFLQCCLGEKLAQAYTLDSSFETLLIGKKSAIEYEVTDALISCKKSGKFPGTSGCLQEILRVRQFSGTNKSYRTQCVSSFNITPEKEIGKHPPPIVIFDGAVAYIKLGHKWRSAHQIVLLDRTERQFVDAVELLNQNYAYRLPGVSKLPVNIPNGIEMMVYRENTQ